MDIEFLAGLTNDPGYKSQGHMIPNNSIVKYLVLNPQVSKTGIKYATHYHQLEKDSAEVLGNKLPDPVYNYKNCGIEYSVIVTDYLDPVTGEFKPVMTNDELPDSIITSRIEQLPLPLALKIINDKDTQYPNLFMKHFKGGRDQSDNVTTTFIPAFPKELNDAKKNKENIDKLTKQKTAYVSLSDELALIVLNNTLGRQMMMYKINNAGKPVYYAVETGMYGFARFYSAKGAYFNLDAFGWNKDTKKEEIFNLGYQCISADKDSLERANDLSVKIQAVIDSKKEEVVEEDEAVF